MGLHRLSECVRCLQSLLCDLSSSAPASAGPGAAASRGPQDPLCIDESSHLESVRLRSWRGMQCCRRCRKASEFTPGLQPPMVPSWASASAPCQPARCVCVCVVLPASHRPCQALLPDTLWSPGLGGHHYCILLSAKAETKQTTQSRVLSLRELSPTWPGLQKSHMGSGVGT